MSNTLERADKLLVSQGLVPSRALAQKLIDEGKVSYEDDGTFKVVPKASLKIEATSEMKVAASELTKFVSRGGLKLEGALSSNNVNVAGTTALDVGQSTGGFTDCLLQLKAKKVVGIEVGHDQLRPELRNREDVVCLEGINARSIPKDLVLSHSPRGYDLIVMDVSFISQTLILPELVLLLTENGKIVSLVKPQFEVGRDGLGKGGIVRDNDQYAKTEQRIRDCCEAIGLKIENYFDSTIKGGDGNREFFIVARKA